MDAALNRRGATTHQCPSCGEQPCSVASSRIHTCLRCRTRCDEELGVAFELEDKAERTNGIAGRDADWESAPRRRARALSSDYGNNFSFSADRLWRASAVHPHPPFSIVRSHGGFAALHIAAANDRCEFQRLMRKERERALLQEPQNK